MLPLYEISRKGKFIEIESTSMGDGCRSANKIKIIWGDGKCLKLDCSNGYTTL